jgi:hypothetical protein
MFLNTHAAAAPGVPKGDERRENTDRTRGDVPAQPLKLQHH